MTTEPISLYVHVPFCVRKCRYCDFCSFPDISPVKRKEYLSALIGEIKGYKDKGLSLKTLFLGGGTPSLLSPSELRELMLAIRESFDTERLTEVTAEINPGTLTEEKARAFLEEGFNRFSIGLQSIHENELKMLGRIHSFEEFLSSYKLLRELGADNISVDLMYGIPEETLSSFEKTLKTVIGLAPEHVSVYGLIVEEGTPFYELKDSLPLPDEDCECDMYSLAASILSDAGYRHYEISNYAKFGRECLHNLVYWRCEEYIGVGCAAYSFFEGRRFGNSRELDRYLSGADRLEYSECVGEEDRAFEYAMLRLRLDEGISLREYEKLFGVDLLSEKQSELERFSALGLIEISGGRLRLTEKGFYLSNTVMSSLL